MRLHSRYPASNYAFTPYQSIAVSVILPCPFFTVSYFLCYFVRFFLHVCPLFLDVFPLFPRFFLVPFLRVFLSSGPSTLVPSLISFHPSPPTYFLSSVTYFLFFLRVFLTLFLHVSPFFLHVLLSSFAHFLSSFTYFPSPFTSFLSSRTAFLPSLISFLRSVHVFPFFLYFFHVHSPWQLCDAMETQMEEGGNVIDFHSCDFFPEHW